MTSLWLVPFRVCDRDHGVLHIERPPVVPRRGRRRRVNASTPPASLSWARRDPRLRMDRHEESVELIGEVLGGR